jgi:serine protease Do
VTARRVLALALALVVVAGVAGVVDARAWGWLGVRIRDLSEQEMEEIASRHGIREGFGVVIVEVIDETPAARAGIRTGDIVVAFGPRPVVDSRMLQRLIAAAPLDRDTELTVLRPEGRRRLEIRVAAMPRPIVGERIAAEFGFVLRGADSPVPTGRRELSAPTLTVGVVGRGSPAEHAGLEVGDVVLTVNDRAVVSGEAAREALADASLEEPLRLTVRRGDEHVSVTLTPR